MVFLISWLSVYSLWTGDFKTLEFILCNLGFAPILSKVVFELMLRPSSTKVAWDEAVALRRSSLTEWPDTIWLSGPRIGLMLVSSDLLGSFSAAEYGDYPSFDWGWDGWFWNDGSHMVIFSLSRLICSDFWRFFVSLTLCSSPDPIVSCLVFELTRELLFGNGSSNSLFKFLGMMFDGYSLFDDAGPLSTVLFECCYLDWSW